MTLSRTYEGALPPRSGELRAIADEAMDAFLEMSPVDASMLGIHSHDGELGDFSQEALDRQARMLGGFETRLRALDPARLDPSDRMDHSVLLGSVQAALLGLGDLGWYRRDPNLYNSVVMGGVLTIARRAYAPLPERMERLCERLEQVPSLMVLARGHLTEMPTIYLQLARAQFPGSAAFLTAEVPKWFAPVPDERLKGRLAAALQGVTRAYSDMDAFFEAAQGQRPSEDPGPPYQLGEARFAAMLRTQEAVTESPKFLLQRGEEELRRLRERLESAAREFDRTLSPEEALRRVGREHGTSESLLGDVRRTLAQLRTFAQGLVTIPDAPDPEVVETPPFMRSTTLASIDPPGPFEDVAAEAYYQVTLPDPSWSAEETEEHMRNLARPTLKIISVHEVYPGHYVQFLHLRRHGSRVARMGMSTAFIEGWAHYTEELAIEEGLDGAPPALRISQAAEALERVGRYLTAIRMHCEGLSWEEAAEEIFIRQCGMEGTPARREAMRGTEDPMYLAYTLGKMEILRLRENLKARGGRAAPVSLKAFHDRLLSFGTPPMPLIAKAMTDE